MAESGGHTDGGRVDPNFCSLRSESACKPCGNNYKTPCKSEMRAWTASVVSQGMDKNAWKYKKAVGEAQRVQNWGGQAHHILCIASVTGKITTVALLERILKVTKWCVNDPANMIALPMWPMTISWYGTFKKGRGGVSWVTTAKAAAKKPPFEGLVQHDYDHDKYNEKVDRALVEVANRAKRGKKGHEKTTSTQLVTDLTTAQDNFRKSLTGRSTHDSWFNGLAGGEVNANWWHAFSMVGASGRKRAFPAPGDKDWSDAFDGLFRAFTKHLGI